MKREDHIKFDKMAHELVSKMTLEEKASMLCSQSPAIERLNIPAYHWWNEGLHGVARAGIATVFPQSIGLAATFCRQTLKTVGEVTSNEGRIKYNLAKKQGDRSIYKGITFWSPNINIYRDPRWGRGHETYGEDPVLTSRLAESYIKGVQQCENGEYEKGAACVKHFAAHSGPEGCRHGFDSIVSDFDLHDTYLPAFEASIKNADVAGVMGAYNMINGVHSCAHPYMESLLRDEWGFDGYYVSDCGALADMHMFCLITHTAVESAALALKSGCDLNCGQVYLSVLQAYNEGLVTEEDITRSAERLISIRYRLGMLDEACTYDALCDINQVESKESLQEAYIAAAKSVVMLKNNGILPLKKGEQKTIGVIGPNAVNQRALEGNYNGTASRYSYILDGITEAVEGTDTRVLYAKGCHVYKEVLESCADPRDDFSEALSVAEASDVIFVCLGLDPSIEGEQGDASNEYGAGDKLTLSFPGLQCELLQRLKATGKPIVLVVLAGGALDLNYAAENADAILYGWYPGAMGGKAIADLAFGDVSPSGKTPVTFYRSLEDIPAFEDYTMQGRTYRYLTKEPLYPFGFGLTYTSFAYRAPVIENKPEEQALYVTAYTKNTGNVDCDAVLQLYATYENEEYTSPNCKLVGFDRIHIKADEEKPTVIVIPYEALKLTDKNGVRCLPKNKITLHFGGGQPTRQGERLTGEQPSSAEIQL